MALSEECSRVRRSAGAENVSRGASSRHRGSPCTMELERRERHGGLEAEESKGKLKAYGPTTWRDCRGKITLHRCFISDKKPTCWLLAQP